MRRPNPKCGNKESMPPASTEGHRTQNQVLTFLIESAQLLSHNCRGFRSAGAELPSLQPTGSIGVKRFAVPGGYFVWDEVPKNFRKRIKAEHVV